MVFLIKVSGLCFLFLLQISLINTVCASVAPPKNPNSAKGCAICHYRWIDVFFVDGKGSDLVEYQAEKVAATPEMCISCHDGSVIDSRARLQHGKGHKTNIIPPSHVRVPDIFPLDEEGKMQCSTCHTAHGVASGTETNETIFLRISNTDSAMCRTCHPNKEGGEKYGNHPLGKSKQKIPISLGIFGPVDKTKKDEIVCESCHTAHGSRYEGYLIKGAGDSALCIECHSDKNIFSPEGERRPFHIINAKPKKVKINKELVRRGAKLGYNGVITCQTCHKVHNNKTEAQLLLIKKDRKSGLCLTCHTDKRGLSETKHNLMNSAPVEKNGVGKTAAEGGICSPCHLPHGTARKPYLTDKKTDFTTQLCLSCHSKGSVAENAKIAGYTHPVNMTLFNERTKNNPFGPLDVEKEALTLPLFNEFGIEDKEGKMTCSTCHNPHKLSLEGSSGDSKADTALNSSGSFLRKPLLEVCSECHSTKFSVLNTKHDLEKVFPNNEFVLKKKKYGSGVCGNCHLVHNSNQEGFLWARDISFKEGNVVKKMCISCHNKEGLGSKRVIKDYSHPVDVFPHEKGISTTLPLYDQSGKRKNNGVMMCHTCHDPHSWTPSKAGPGNRIEVEGTPQNSFLRIENSPSSKLCTNCHIEELHIEKTDHDLAITAPLSINSAGKTPAESGVCGVCHLVHNSKNRIRLWAQDLAAGDNIMEKMCYSCHLKNGNGENKIPQISSHPRSQVIARTKSLKNGTPSFPIFHEISGKKVSAGEISCASCHNVHQWSEQSFTETRAAGVEGNATNSFLRSLLHNNVCRECHGIEALYRFKFFHKLNKRMNKISISKTK